jgi:hypothetical protein
MTSENTHTTLNRIAIIISALFHPLLTPVYGMLIIFSAPTLFGYLPFSVKKILFFIVLVNNVLLPLSLLPYFRYRGIISSWMIEERKERTAPMVTTSFFYLVTAYIFLRFQIPLFIKYFILVSAVMSIAVTIINFWWKISIHAVGSGALIALVMVLSIKMHTPLTWFLISVIMASGLVMSARLWLNSHSPAEVWSGFLLGLLVPVLLLFVS